MDNEADKFSIHITPVIFNANLNIHILDGSGLNRQGKTNISLKRIPSLDSRNNPTINLLYKFTNFSILYSPELVKLTEKKGSQSENNNNTTSNKNTVNKPSSSPNTNLLGDLPVSYCDNCKKETETVLNENMKVCKICLSKNTEYIKILKSNIIQTKSYAKLQSYGMINCQKCKKETEAIGFNHLQDFSMCKPCVEKNINKIVNGRVKQFIAEDYINKECIIVIK